MLLTRTLEKSSQKPENRASGNCAWKAGLVSWCAAAMLPGRSAKKSVTAWAGPDSASAGALFVAFALFVASAPGVVSAPGVDSSLGVGSGSVEPRVAAVVAGDDGWAAEPPASPSGPRTSKATSPASSNTTRAAPGQMARPRPRPPAAGTGRRA